MMRTQTIEDARQIVHAARARYPEGCEVWRVLDELARKLASSERAAAERQETHAEAAA